MNKLHFISNYNKLLKQEIQNIKDHLTKSNLIGCVALSEKIEHMICNIGQPESVEPMIKAILKGTKWIKFDQDHNENGTIQARKERPEDNYMRSAKGHFRWDYKVYTLTDKELKIVEKLLKPW